MNEFFKFSKDLILIESIRVLKRHNCSEEEIDGMLREKFNLTDEEIKNIKEKEQNEGGEM